MTADFIGTVAVTVMFLAAVQALSLYAIVHLLVTGRGIIQRREQEPEPARILHRGER